MSATARLRLAFQALWNVRVLGLFLIGPVVGIGIGAATFGLSPTLQRAAFVMFLLPLGLYAMLARGEWQRLANKR